MTNIFNFGEDQESSNKVLKQIKDTKKSNSLTEKLSKASVDVQSKTLKVQKLQTQSIRNIDKSMNEFLRLMKDQNSNVKYSSVSNKQSSSSSTRGGVSGSDDDSGNTFIGGLGGLGKSKGGKTSAGKSKGLLGKVFGPLGKIGGKFTKLLGPIGLAITAFQALGGISDGVKKASEWFGTELPSMQQNISAGIGGAIESISFGFFDAENSALKINKSIDIISGTFNDFGTTLSDSYKDFTGMISGAMEWVKGSALGKWFSDKTDTISNNPAIKEVTKNLKDTYEKTKESFFGKDSWIGKTTTQWKDFWLTDETKGSVSGPSHVMKGKTPTNQLKLLKNLETQGLVQLNRAYQPQKNSRITILPDGTALVGGSKAFRNNNPGNISGMGGLRYGASGIAVTTTGDKGDQRQLIFDSYADGVNAWDQMVAKNYSKGSIRQEFSKYQTEGFKGKLDSWEKAGIDTDRSISWYKQNDPEKYKKFRDIMFRHEGYVEGKRVKVSFAGQPKTIQDDILEETHNSRRRESRVQERVIASNQGNSSQPDTRSINSYPMDSEEVLEYQARTGVS